MLTKAQVSFEHPAKGKNHCGDCVHFEVRSPQSCEIVSGHVESGDWCSRFRRKPMPVEKGPRGVHREMSKFKEGTLHGGSPKGPVVTNRKQAVAIALSEAGMSKKKKGFRI